MCTWKAVFKKCKCGSQLHAEDAADEFSAHFNHEHVPQILITSSRWCSTVCSSSNTLEFNFTEEVMVWIYYFYDVRLWVNFISISWSWSKDFWHSSWICKQITIKFIAELLQVIPNTYYYKRGSYELKQVRNHILPQSSEKKSRIQGLRKRTLFSIYWKLFLMYLNIYNATDRKICQEPWLYSYNCHPWQ
jgi:hypothetical protein